MERQPQAGVRQFPVPPPPIIVRPPGPDSPTPSSGGSLLPPLPAWAGLALSVILIIAQQTAIGLGHLPPSAPITVALVVLGIVSATAAALQGLFAQYSAHTQAMARLRLPAVQALPAMLSTTTSSPGMNITFYGYGEPPAGSAAKKPPRPPSGPSANAVTVNEAGSTS